MSVKYVIFFVAVFAAVFHTSEAISQEKKDEIKAKLLPTLGKCGKEYNINLEYLKEFKAQKKRVDDSNSCFFACVAKDIGLIDASGKFSPTVALEKAEKIAEGKELEQAKSGISTCTSVNDQAVTDGEKGCDRAKLVFNCLADQVKVFGIAI